MHLLRIDFMMLSRLSVFVSACLCISLLEAVHATPLKARGASLVTLPFAKRLNTTGKLNILANDRIRIQNLRAKGAGPSENVKASIVGNVPTRDETLDYVVNVQIGSPPNTYALLIDTVSANTWVGASKPYIQTQTSVQSPNRVEIEYVDGAAMLGTEFTDQVSLGTGLTTVGQSIGAATETAGFDLCACDGILGIGPRGLSLGTLSPASTTTIPTITDSLFQQAAIPANMVAIAFVPESAGSNTIGEISFGGTDLSRVVGSINFVPTVKTGPSSGFWALTQSIVYGTGTTKSTSVPILTSTTGILDTGTTFTFIATDAFQAYQTATGAVLDRDTGLLKLTVEEFANLKSLFFIINGVAFEFTADAQIWPRGLNAVIGGDTQHVYLVITDIGADTGSGMDFASGMTWVERYYVVLDTTNQRIGIANTPTTRSTANMDSGPS